MCIPGGTVRILWTVATVHQRNSTDGKHFLKPNATHEFYCRLPVPHSIWLANSHWHRRQYCLRGYSVVHCSAMRLKFLAGYIAGRGPVSGRAPNVTS